MNTSAGFLPMRIAPNALLSSSMQGVKPEVPADTTVEIRLADGTTIRVAAMLLRRRCAGCWVCYGDDPRSYWRARLAGDGRHG
jgi:hypothetical protein